MISNCLLSIDWLESWVDLPLYQNKKGFDLWVQYNTREVDWPTSNPIASVGDTMGQDNRLKESCKTLELIDNWRWREWNEWVIQKIVYNWTTIGHHSMEWYYMMTSPLTVKRSFMLNRSLGVIGNELWEWWRIMPHITLRTLNGEQVALTNGFEINIVDYRIEWNGMEWNGIVYDGHPFAHWRQSIG